MKEEAIKKINGMGKAGNIIVTIAKIICIIGIVGIIAGMILINCLPKNGITMTGGGYGEIKVDTKAFGEELTDKEIEQIKATTVDVNDKNFEVTDINKETGVITYHANGELEHVFEIRDLLPVLAIALITVIVTMISLTFGGGLCKAFKTCESPFEDNVITKMRNFAFSLIPWVILNSINNSIATSVFSGKWNINMSVDLNMVAVVLIILALTYIFKYGAMLQQESDETL